MKDRLVTLLKSESLTAVKFAEIMEVQPSSISHLLSGRNKPNFDFISKLMFRFPELSPDWIINGTGEMYRNDKSEASSVFRSFTNVKRGDITGVITDGRYKSENDDRIISGIARDLNGCNIVDYTEGDSRKFQSLGSDSHVYINDSQSNDEQPSFDIDESINIDENRLSSVKPSITDGGASHNMISDSSHREGKFIAQTPSSDSEKILHSSKRNIKRIIILFDDESYEILDK